MRVRTDDQAQSADVTALLSDGSFADALVPAALQAEQLGVLTRSLTFLAEIVRRGGTEYAAQLPEPLPTPEQSTLVLPWLVTGADDERLARWLDGVATLIETRRLTAP